MSRSLIAAAIVAIAALLSGCSGEQSHDVAPPMEADDLFPSTTLSDWVTYATQISVVHVTSERRLRGSAGAETEAPDYIGRSVHIVVDRNLWLAHGTAPRTEFDLVVAGWKSQDGHEIKTAVLDSPRIEPGDVLVIPLSEDPHGAVTLLSPHAIVPIQAEPVDAHGQLDAAIEALTGKSYDQMSVLLAATPIDPAAVPFEDLAPYERYRKVSEARSATTISPTR